jgi:hypothetical protein
MAAWLRWIQAQVQEDQDRTKADEQGKNYEDSTQADASMWRHTQRENLKDNRYRARLFFVGVVLVIFGFVGQTLGSLPYGIPFLGFGNCLALLCAPSAKHNTSERRQHQAGIIWFVTDLRSSKEHEIESEHDVGARIR